MEWIFDKFIEALIYPHVYNFWRDISYKYDCAMSYQIQRDGSNVPEHNLAVPGATDNCILVQPNAAGAEVRMAGQHFHNLLVPVVPDAHRVIRTAGKHFRKIR